MAATEANNRRARRSRPGSFPPATPHSRSSFFHFSGGGGDWNGAGRSDLGSLAVRSRHEPLAGIQDVGAAGFQGLIDFLAKGFAVFVEFLEFFASHLANDFADLEA